MPATVDRQTQVGKQSLSFRPGHRYGLLVDARGVTLSVHDDLDPGRGLVWVSGSNRRGDHRPALLDVTQARALRDALDLFLADHDNDTNRHDIQGHDHESQ